MTLLHQAAQKAVEAQAVHAAVREAGGIVHSDGNIFFTNAAKFMQAVSALQQQEVPREPELREAAKQFHNLTQGDPEVIIRPPSAEKRDAIIAAGQRLRAALTCQCGVECQDLRDGCRYRAASPSTTQQQEAGSGPAAHHHEAWWLIEYTVSPRPLYYAGPRRHKRPHVVELVEDASKAARFPTEDAAKLTIARMVGADTSKPLWHLQVGTSGYRAAEHIFDYTPLAAAPSTPESAEKDDAGGGKGAGPVRLWAMHIAGPDDVHAAPGEAEARAAAERFNAWFAQRKDPHPLDPQMHATAIEWPHSAEAHANDLPRWRDFVPPAAGVEGKCECGLSEVACRDPLRRSCPDGVPASRSEPTPPRGNDGGGHA